MTKSLSQLKKLNIISGALLLADLVLLCFIAAQKNAPESLLIILYASALVVGLFPFSLQSILFARHQLKNQTRGLHYRILFAWDSFDNLAEKICPGEYKSNRYTSLYMLESAFKKNLQKSDIDCMHNLMRARLNILSSGKTNLSIAEERMLAQESEALLKKLRKAISTKEIILNACSDGGFA